MKMQSQRVTETQLGFLLPSSNLKDALNSEHVSGDNFRVDKGRQV